MCAGAPGVEASQAYEKREQGHWSSAQPEDLQSSSVRGRDRHYWNEVGRGV